MCNIYGKKRNLKRIFPKIFFIITIIGTIVNIIIFKKLIISHVSGMTLFIYGSIYPHTIKYVKKEIITLNLPNNSLLQDVKLIERCLNKLPWIKKINVRKKWPNILEIFLLEYIPIAYWNNIYLIDKNGTLFYFFKNHSLEFIPKLYGPYNSEAQVLNGYINMKKILEKIKLQLKIVSINHRQSWKIITNNDISIILGRENYLKRLNIFVALYPFLKKQAIKKNKRINHVDLRYNSGAAVLWSSVLTTH